MRGFSLVALLRSLQRVNSLILSHFQRTADGRVGFVDVCTRKYEVRYLTREIILDLLFACKNNLLKSFDHVIFL